MIERSHLNIFPHDIFPNNLSYSGSVKTQENDPVGEEKQNNLFTEK